MHDGVNPTRITFTTAGTYIIGANVPWAAHATGIRVVQFRHSTIGVLTEVVQQAVTVAATNTVQCLVTIRNMAAASYVEVFGYQSSGGALNVVGGANDMPAFWAVRVA
jgi:hypothetical protein